MKVRSEMTVVKDRSYWFLFIVLFASACSAGNDANNAPDGSSPAPTIDAGAPDVVTEAAPADAGHPPSDASGDHKPPPPQTCITPASPQSCSAPVNTALPLCKLTQTGCMDSTNPTHFTAKAIPYEVNSPLWSDNAAKSRAFVLPTGGTIHVKNCASNATAAELAECVAPNGISNGPADTGKWVFPVGTVLIKNFMFDGKLVETRLFMRVDTATAAMIQNGSDWVGYNYAWNEAQTEATLVPNARYSVKFNTGTRTVDWNYPNFIDCIGCHAPAVGPIGPETRQMNRQVGGTNQIDKFVSLGLFGSTPPPKPYMAALVEPYANAALGLTGPPPGATTDQRARSYLSANCGYCHRPDVNDQGFDLRASLSFAQTGLCNLLQQNGIPGVNDPTLVELLPGNHAKSALWMRMNIPVPASDTNGVVDVGRMPSVGTFNVDQQGTDLVASWVDSIPGCPDAGP